MKITHKTKYGSYVLEIKSTAIEELIKKLVTNQYARFARETIPLLTSKEMVIISLAPEIFQIIFNKYGIRKIQFLEMRDGIGTCVINENSFLSLYYPAKQKYDRDSYIINLGICEKNNHFYILDLHKLSPVYNEKNNCHMLNLGTYPDEYEEAPKAIIAHQYLFSDENNVEKLILEKSQMDKEFLTQRFLKILNKIIQDNSDGSVENLKLYLDVLFENGQEEANRGKIECLVMAFFIQFDSLKENDKFLTCFVDSFKKNVEKAQTKVTEQLFIIILKILRHALVTNNLSLLNDIIEAVENVDDDIGNRISEYIYLVISDSKISTQLFRVLLNNECLHNQLESDYDFKAFLNEDQKRIVEAYRIFFEGMKQAVPVPDSNPYPNPFLFVSKILAAISYDAEFSLRAIENYLDHRIGENLENETISNNIPLEFFMPILEAIPTIAKIAKQQLEIANSVRHFAGALVGFDFDKCCEKGLFKNNSEKMSFIKEKYADFILALETMIQPLKETIKQPSKETEQKEDAGNTLAKMAIRIEISMPNENKIYFDRLVGYLKNITSFDMKDIGVLLTVMPFISDTDKSILHYYLHRIYDEQGPYSNNYNHSLYHCMRSVSYGYDIKEFKDFLSKTKETETLFYILAADSNDRDKKLANRNDIEYHFFMNFVKEHSEELPQFIRVINFLYEQHNLSPNSFNQSFESDIFIIIKNKISHEIRHSIQNSLYEVESFYSKMMDIFITINGKNDNKIAKLNLDNQILLINELLLELKNDSSFKDNTRVKEIVKIMLYHKIILQNIVNLSKDQPSSNDMAAIFSILPDDDYKHKIVFIFNKTFEKMFPAKNTKPQSQFFEVPRKNPDLNNLFPDLLAIIHEVTAENIQQKKVLLESKIESCLPMITDSMPTLLDAIKELKNYLKEYDDNKNEQAFLTQCNNWAKQYKNLPQGMCDKPLQDESTIQYH